ncbi:MAG TPA: SAV_6107 family HEPN domain-containing protein [Mycobacteriales bacterium]|nr:SAV_6107 family HEPN domain-containing protein [Mycobacteriales bacterium]
MTVASITARAGTGPDSAGLLGLSRRGVAEAAMAPNAAQRYAAAHLAALRAAAAVVAAKAQPDQRAGSRRRPISVWVLLSRVAPELAEWASFFAAGARKRAAAEAGLVGQVSAREADDLLRDAETFLHVAESVLRVTHQEALPLLRPGA